MRLAEGISAMRHHGDKPLIHLLRCCRQPPTSVDKEAGERDAVAGGLLLSGQVNHRNRMENGSSKNKTRLIQREEIGEIERA